MEQVEQRQGSAAFQGALWDTHAEAWAEHEPQQLPIYEDLLERTAVGTETTVLDVGCGAGVLLRAAVDRGAQVAGIDAAPTLVAIARSRVPEAEIQVGDLQFLPYPDGTFDVVAGCNAFQFAADFVSALREARRVAKPGGFVVIQVWGRAERCDLGAAIRALVPLLPGPLPSGPGGRALSDPGVLEALATEAGLTPSATGDIESAFTYADEAALLRATTSGGMVVLAVQASGEQAVRAAIVESLEPFRDLDGSYRLENEWHYLIATA